MKNDKGYCCICRKKVNYKGLIRNKEDRLHWISRFQIQNFKPSMRMCKKHVRADPLDAEQTPIQLINNLNAVKICPAAVPHSSINIDSLMNNADNSTDHSILYCEISCATKKRLIYSSPYVEGIQMHDENMTKCSKLSHQTSKPSSIIELSPTATSLDLISHVSSVVETPQHTVKRIFHYFEDFEPSDMDTPRRARLALKIAKEQLAKSTKKIAQLTSQNHYLQKKIVSLSDGILKAKNRNMLTEDAVVVLQL